jgi:hypothetical protein
VPERPTLLIVAAASARRRRAAERADVRIHGRVAVAARPIRRRSDFPPVYRAFVLLSQAAASAYYSQSVEDDAYGAGNAGVDAFPGAGW